LAFERNNVFLLLLGYDEEQIASHFKEYSNLISERNFLYYGPTNEPQKMLQTGDVFVLPTYREGFGSSVIEASALGLPVICSDAYGVMDAMIDGVTGLRCKVGDVVSLYNAMKTIADNPALIKELGQAGQKRIVRDFDGKKITQYWVEYYNDLLKA
jgi:glycosyltransferase involved in cell wall biosynthesis